MKFLFKLLDLFKKKPCCKFCKQSSFSWIGIEATCENAGCVSQKSQTFSWGQLPFSRRLCRHCGKFCWKENVITSYWTPIKFACHKTCETKQKEVVIEQQTIDANCNDCKFFKRERLLDKTNNTWEGTCLRFNKKTIAQPGVFQGNTCFEHRKT